MKLIQKNNLFLYLLILTGFFLLLEISFFLQWIHFYLGDYEVIANHFVIPKIALPPIISFIGIQLGIHFIYALSIWLIAALMGFALAFTGKKIEKMGLFLWVIGLVAILLANQHFFPNSKFTYMLDVIVPAKVGLFLLIILLTLFMAALYLAAVGLFMLSRNTFYILMVVMMVIVYVSHVSQAQKKVVGDLIKPNIILIGIDSLRPDFLTETPSITPSINAFLNHATVFPDAMTPLARTFPAWVSLLTGQYPKHNGIRTNLADQSALDLTHTLPAILRKQGYATIFATDETRFSNIDKHFGFDATITPPIGVNDFLLGTINDFPLSNLIINTRLGKYLFPYSYANRGVFTAYDPKVFIKSLDENLKQVSHRPLFFSVHFCLPHFPYFWGKQLAEDQPIQNYRKAVQRVDYQFNELMKVLSENKLLDNSIVVLLSDHGEAIELSGDRVTDARLFKGKGKMPRFYPPSVQAEAVDQSAGHGTDVLSLTQYRVLLAFRFYQGGRHEAKRVMSRASLLDIKPSLLSLLAIQDDQSDGSSLFAPSHKKDFFVESDFSPEAVITVKPEMRKVLLEGMDYFQVDPVTARVVVKPEMLKLIMASKQYADIYQNWILAFYPQSHHQVIPILVNLKTGEWTNDLSSSFAKKSPLRHMMVAMRNFYDTDFPATI